MTKKRALKLLMMWFIAFAMAGVLCLLIYLQMADHQENAVATLVIGPPEELNDNDTADQFSEDNGTLKDNDDEIVKKISNGTDWSHLVETDSPFWDVIPISNPGVSSENWHTIMVQNHYKFDSTITPLSPREWHLVSNKKSIRVQFPYEMTAVKDILARKKRGKFSIQLISIEHDQFSHAVSLLKRLVHDGYYAYLQRTETKFEEKYWYRVRVGFFKNLEDARMTGREINQKYHEEGLFPSKFWPVQPGPQELSRPVIDLRQPLNKSWVIQLPLYKNQSDALKDLADISTKTDFSYISQKLESSSSEELLFRIRIGFFETKREAQRIIYGLKKKLPQLKSFKTTHL
ncbi:MAG: SPOR domain-containing protein [SAR324 cluster bacterium]|nr:SPOR domain-containing protein [SAR324 cluster bacterium]